MVPVRKLLLIACLLTIPQLRAEAFVKDNQPKEKSMLDRIMRFYSWNDPKAPKTAYQGKQFKGGGEFGEKKFATGDYSGIKAFSSKEFGTKSYADSGKSWISRIFPVRKLPENLQGASRDASKRFQTGDYATKAYNASGKGDPYAGKQPFETRQVEIKGKTQGALDNDPKLQEAVRKGLSIDDIRKLLNKTP
jgi:hypothetical protein